MSQTTTQETQLLPPYIVHRCPHCGAFLFEGRLPKGSYIKTLCRRCKPEAGKPRPEIVIER